MALWIPFALLAIASGFDLWKGEIPDSHTVLLFLWAGSGNAFEWIDVGWGRSILCSLLAFASGAVSSRFGLLGRGDVKLLVGLGSCLGPMGLIVTLLFSALVGGLLSLVALVRGERELAYAPAMAGGLVIAIVSSGGHAHAPAV